MRNFVEEDFRGGGQYLILNRKGPNQYHDAGYMSTLMIKIGWNMDRREVKKAQYCKVSMADGWTHFGYYDTRNDPGFQVRPRIITTANIDTWIWVPFVTRKDLVEYLNNPDLSEEYRFATQEEVVRVVMNQAWRWRTPEKANVNP